MWSASRCAAFPDLRDDDPANPAVFPQWSNRIGICNLGGCGRQRALHVRCYDRDRSSILLRSERGGQS